MSQFYKVFYETHIDKTAKSVYSSWPDQSQSSSVSVGTQGGEEVGRPKNANQEKVKQLRKHYITSVK